MKGKIGNGGFAEGEALVAKTSLSFWGSFDARTGMIIEPGHDLRGQRVTQKILVIPSTKGSSGNEDMVYYGSKHKTGPLAIISVRGDPLLVVGSTHAKIPYIFNLDGNPIKTINSGDHIVVDGDKGIIIVKKCSRC